MISLIENVTDLIAITNVSHLIIWKLTRHLTFTLKDMHSYRLELSRGLEVHNVVTAIMEEYHLDLQQALY